MSDQSHIEWTNATWNPVTGCTKVSAGCKNCYAERFAERFRGVPNHPYEQGFDLKLWPDRLNIPLRWQEPRMIFVNSMSDLFHEDVPFEYIAEVFQVMKQAEHHTFQVLTKRSARLKKIASELEWPDNVWMGVSVENMKVASRVDDLREVPAAIRFLSCEPLLGSLKELSLAGIQWVIVGGESGPGARHMEEAWVKELRSKCGSARIPFFFKQWGGPVKSKRGRELDGEVVEAFPRITA